MFTSPVQQIMLLSLVQHIRFSSQVSTSGSRVPSKSGSRVKSTHEVDESSPARFSQILYSSVVHQVLESRPAHQVVDAKKSIAFSKGNSMEISENFNRSTI